MSAITAIAAWIGAGGVVAIAINGTWRAVQKCRASTDVSLVAEADSFASACAAYIDMIEKRIEDAEGCKPITVRLHLSEAFPSESERGRPCSAATRS